MRLALPLISALLALHVASARAEEPRIRAVATFSVLADIARQVGGDRVEVTALVGPDGDAHEFEPSPADARRLSAAAIVITNGLGLEGWMDRLIAASGTKAPVVTASSGIVPVREEPDGADGATPEREAVDPHAWQSVANVKVYAANIRDGLVRVDPAGAAAYAANAGHYLAELDRLDADIRAAIAKIPPKRRVIITTHDAFGYFGRAYGMRFLAPEGVSTASEATARDVARIIRQIRADKVPAVFLENVSDPRLMTRIAQEGGARIGAKVYSDALSAPGGPAATYVAMMRHNVGAFRDALTP